MRVVLALIGALLLATTASVAQQAKTPKGKAPTAQKCIPCPQLCALRAKKNPQTTNLYGCQNGCRGWAAYHGGKGPIYVRKDLSRCGLGPMAYAPIRCE